MLVNKFQIFTAPLHLVDSHGRNWREKAKSIIEACIILHNMSRCYEIRPEDVTKFEYEGNELVDLHLRVDLEEEASLFKWWEDYEQDLHHVYGIIHNLSTNNPDYVEDTHDATDLKMALTKFITRYYYLDSTNTLQVKTDVLV